MTTLGAALEAAASRLAGAGIAGSRHEARLVLALAAGLDPASILAYPERALERTAAARLDELTARRARGEPLARLRGCREFWSLDFALSAATLDPRPDSETLIEAALARIADRDAALRILDFGTGTGCLLLALLSELPNATGLGIDVAPGAVATATANAARLELSARASFRLGDWDKEIAGPADVILANPPYISSSEMAALPPEVAAYDPRIALDGGPDGLAAYRALGPAALRLLDVTGFAVFEIGSGQSEDVALILVESGLRIKEIRNDLAGVARCIVATR